MVTTTQPITSTRTVTTTHPVTTTNPITTTKTVTTTARCNTTVPDDFYIIYETSWLSPGRFVTLLHTNYNIIGKPLSLSEYTSTDYYISCEDLQAIYDGLIKYDIKAYSNQGLLKSEHWVMVPNIYYRVTFRINGELYSLLYDTSACTPSYFSSAAEEIERFQNLIDFAKILDNLFMNTDEYKSLPQVKAPLT